MKCLEILFAEKCKKWFCGVKFVGFWRIIREFYVQFLGRWVGGGVGKIGGVLGLGFFW